jgi:hypothetical protein
MAGRIHQDQPLFRRREGVFDHFFQGLRSPFVDAPEGFLLQGGDAAFNIARRRVGAADILPGLDCFGLPLLDQVQDLLADFGSVPGGPRDVRPRSAPWFRQDHGPAASPGGRWPPYGRIGARSGGEVGPAAFLPRINRNGDGPTLDFGRIRQHLLTIFLPWRWSSSFRPPPESRYTPPAYRWAGWPPPFLWPIDFRTRFPPPGRHRCWGWCRTRPRTAWSARGLPPLGTPEHVGKIHGPFHVPGDGSAAPRADNARITST